MKNIRKFIVLITVALIAVSSFFLLAACNDTPEYPDRRLPEEDTMFYVDFGTSKIKDNPLGLASIFFEQSESYILLRADGTATIKLLTKPVGGVLGLPQIQEALAGATFSETEIDTFVNMIYGYLPGADFTDLDTVQTSFQSTLGLTLIGLDGDNEQVQNLFTSIVNDKALPSEINLPSDLRLGIEVTGEYYIKDVYSEHTDTTHTGVFMGKHHEDGEAFLLMTLTENPETNVQRVQVMYRAMKLELNAYTKSE
ncbi:MAG: hypothetical protein WC292_01620 [Clostridia bacterium]